MRRRRRYLVSSVQPAGTNVKKKKKTLSRFGVELYKGKVTMEEDEMELSTEELQSLVRDEVNNTKLISPGLLEQYGRLHSLLKKREKQISSFLKLCRSVEECEKVVKELYTLIGWEYRDSDSDNESTGRGCRLPLRSERRIQSSAKSNDLDLQSSVRKVKRKKKKWHSILNRKAVVVLTRLSRSQIMSALHQPPSQTDNSENGFLSCSDSDKQWQPGDSSSESESSLSDFDIWSMKRRKIQLRRKTRERSLRTSRKSETLAAVIDEPKARKLTARKSSSSTRKRASTSHTSSNKDEKFKRKLRASTRNTTPEANTTKTSEANTIKTFETNTTETPESNATETPESNATETPESNATETPESNATETPESNATETHESNTTEPPESNATEPPESNATEPPESNATEPPESNATETPESNATETPESNATETPESNTTKPPESNSTKPPESNTTKPPESNTTKPKTSEGNKKTNAESNQATTSTPSANPTVLPIHRTAPIMPTEEVTVNMKVLARKRELSWQRGKILEIVTKDDGRLKYKVTFEEKGRRLVSGHHIAFSNMPKVEQLFIGARVVVQYKAEKTEFMPGIMAELPNRKNRMRFLVFIDDHTPVYVGLPLLHLVCKPLADPLSDILDPTHQGYMREYLKRWPYPPQTQYKIGQNLNLECDGSLQKCVIVTLDSSLVEVSYVGTQKKEWVFRGSIRFEHMSDLRKKVLSNKDKAKDTNSTPG